MQHIWHWKRWVGLGIWCWTPLSTIFRLYRGSLFYWWRKPDYPEKTTNLQFNIYNLMWLHMFQYTTSENCKLKKCKKFNTITQNISMYMEPNALWFFFYIKVMWKLSDLLIIELYSIWCIFFNSFQFRWDPISFLLFDS